MKLGGWPLPYVRVKCATCDREGRMNMSGLIERFRPDREMFVVRQKLTQPSCKLPDKKQPCQSVLPDALLVQAILAERDEDVVAPEFLPEAREWRSKLEIGMEGRPWTDARRAEGITPEIKN
jgi:hypothetical protein